MDIITNIKVNKNTKVIDSREVAEMLDKQHKSVLRYIEGSKDRKGIIEILGQNQMVLSNYFIKSSYINSQNKEQPCYLCTKMGCEILANKMTGEKGVLFTARYVKRFNELEQHIKNNIDSYMIQDPIERAKRWIKEETIRIEQAKQLEEQKPKVEYHDKVLKPSNDDGTRKLLTVTSIAKDLGMTAQELNKKLHEEGVIFKRGNIWFPYKKYNNMIPEYMDYEINEFNQILKFTEKGRKWVIKKIIKNPLQIQNNVI